MEDRLACLGVLDPFWRHTASDVSQVNRTVPLPTRPPYGFGENPKPLERG